MLAAGYLGNMLFWIIAAVLTLGASLTVLLPFTRHAEGEAGTSHDLEVYRDQLGEIDKDTARGLIAPSDVEQARAALKHGERIATLTIPDDGGPVIDAASVPSVFSSRATMTQ